MYSSVTVFKRMQENKTVGNCRCMDDWCDFTFFHPLVGFNQPGHQIWKVTRLWTDKMNDLLLISDRLPDIILTDAIIAVFESRVNDPVLKL